MHIIFTCLRFRHIPSLIFISHPFNPALYDPVLSCPICIRFSSDTIYRVVKIALVLAWVVGGQWKREGEVVGWLRCCGEVMCLGYVDVVS